jgi:hypothetical protein
MTKKKKCIEIVLKPSLFLPLDFASNELEKM